MSDAWSERAGVDDEAPGGGADDLEIFQTTGRLLAALGGPRSERAERELRARFGPAVFGYVRRLGGSYELGRELADTVLDRFLLEEREVPTGPGTLAARLRSTLEDALRVRAEELLSRTRPILDTFFEQEWRDALVRASLERVLEEVGEEVFEVYRRVVLSNEKIEKVSRALDLTHLAVTSRTHRISHRIRSLRAALEDERRPRPRD